jgi:hypothetical protein
MLGQGPNEVRLVVFGKLMRDQEAEYTKDVRAVAAGAKRVRSCGAPALAKQQLHGLFKKQKAQLQGWAAWTGQACSGHQCPLC